MYYLKNTNFWMFGLFFFFYFFIMGAYFPFFPIWLHDINHISKSDTGIIFAAISLFSLLFQPLFGLLSDKLGLRKYLLWMGFRRSTPITSTFLQQCLINGSLMFTCQDGLPYDVLY
ncbi:TPA: MFS transporter [Escherichia coli]